MYCKNCGNEMDDLAVVCVSCGVAKSDGKDYCFNCGNSVNPDADFCTQCGTATNNKQGQTGNQQFNNSQNVYGQEHKSKLAAGILGILLGWLGIHNFYLGYTQKAVVQLLLGTIGSVLTCGLGSIASGIWGLVEGIMILTGSIATDANGVPLKDN